MIFRHCQFFRAGEDVPSWLLDAEPTEPSAERPRLTWIVDAHVIETERGYFVVPMQMWFRSIIEATGGRDATIFAASREVMFPYNFQVLTPRGDGKDDNVDPEPPILSGVVE